MKSIKLITEGLLTEDTAKTFFDKWVKPMHNPVDYGNKPSWTADMSKSGEIWLEVSMRGTKSDAKKAMSRVSIKEIEKEAKALKGKVDYNFADVGDYNGDWAEGTMVITFPKAKAKKKTAANVKASDFKKAKSLYDFWQIVKGIEDIGNQFKLEYPYTGFNIC